MNSMPQIHSRWSVGLVVDDPDLSLLSRSEVVRTMLIPEVVHGMVIGLSIISDGEEDVPGVRIEVMAPDAESAVSRAQHLLYQGRRAAKLPDAVLPVAWVRRLRDGQESNERFLDQAKELVENEQPELAIVSAHIYLEAHLKAQWEFIADREGDVELRRRIEQERGIGNLKSAGCQSLIRSHFCIEVEGLKIWQDFERSVVRRNAVTHGGEPVSAEDAWASIHVVEALVKRLGVTHA